MNSWPRPRIPSLIYVTPVANMRPMLRRPIQRGILWLLLSAMLFAQAATAADACLRASMAPDGATEESAHCAVEKKVNLNLCLYQFADQSDQGALDVALPAFDSPVLVVAEAAASAMAPAPGFVADTLRFSHGPPIPIRFCSLLI
jgi:hypothetical protein